MRLKLPAFLLLICLLTSLAVLAKPIKKRKIKKLFKHSAIVNDHFTGFALYDMDKQEMIYELNDDKYYTPASNTKLYTFYTSLRMLGDSIPALRYVTRGDSLIFWATGDPSFLHSDLKGTRGLEFLKNSNKHLYFSSGWYQNRFYGTGWPYGDYNDYYQAEINELPLEDNVALLYAGTDGKLKIRPAYLSNYLKQDSTLHPRSFSVERNLADNTFNYPAMPVPAKFRQEIPWKTSPALTMAMLQDTLKSLLMRYTSPCRPMLKPFTTATPIRFTAACCNPAITLLPSNCCWYVHLLNLGC
jgi:D-alanyl-D-alanine carboxypeptidase/D-alanyl-D-alanine-endopeptidase (penicillin-binding protein 4)